MLNNKYMHTFSEELQSTVSIYYYYIIHVAKEKDLTESRSLLKEIHRKRKGIQKTIVRGRERTSAEVWKSLERTYAQDIRVRSS